MRIAFHLYELHSDAPLGAHAQSTVRHGVLLRAEFPGGVLGYADLHPWPELGDLPLDVQLSTLARAETTALSRASLAFAQADANARAEERSLWQGLEVPPSHFLVPGTAGSAEPILSAALAEGFTHFKVKIGRDLDAEARFLREAAAVLQRAQHAAGPPLRLRLDANESLTAAQFADFYASLGEARALVDYVEDPCAFDSAAWNTLRTGLGVTLAVDRAAEETRAAGFVGPVIAKPARTGPSVDAPPEPRASRRVVTSYLDHPLGQLCAAWVAARLAVDMPHETHGLVSHRVYARTAFSDALGWRGPVLHTPDGYGFGFDTLLARLEWQPLSATL